MDEEYYDDFVEIIESYATHDFIGYEKSVGYIIYEVDDMSHIIYEWEKFWKSKNKFIPS